ncbi:MAG: DUF2059 domain-containing protein [Rhodanobacteraceae bacterium]|nr:DUF2059 domain-containing protein [Pseudomonadota bacterium]
MRFRKNMLVGSAFMIALWVASAHAAPPAAGGTGGGASAQQVRALMDTIGLKRMLAQMNGAMAQQINHVVPCLPAATVQQTFNSQQAQDDIINRMIPVYQQHFSNADIQGLLTFYRSPLGQKVLREMPATMQQGMQIGQQWGMERAQAMVAQMKQQGVLNAQGQCPAPQQAPAVPPPVKK